MMRVVFLFLLMLVPAMARANGVALVIGNSAYANVAALDNPANDARAVAAALTRQGFDVVTGLDLDRTRLRNALRDFRAKADNAEVALVYYAGHGIEIGGVNYLIPVDARLEDERDAGLEMVEMDLILRQISGAKTLKMVVLDACRNNPFVVKMRRENTGRNVGQGLGRVDFAQADTLIAYAAAAGEVTPDGVSGKNSPFTRAFVNALSGPPADVRRLLGRARDELRRSVPGAAPFVYTSLGGEELVINPLSAPPAPVPAPIPANPAPAYGSISADFVRIDRDGTLADWDAFLIRWESQSEHPLYAFALEKREALKADGTSRGEPAHGSAVPAPSETMAALATPKPMQTPQPPAAKPEPVPVPVPVPAPVPAPTRSRDTAARELQEIMQERRCYRGAIDGLLGRGSRRGLAAFGAQIGRDLTLPTGAETARIDAVIRAFRDHPQATCPVVKAPARQPTTGTAATSRPKGGQKQAAKPKSSETTTVDGSNLTVRGDPGSRAPLSPFDCVGESKTLYDCD